MGASVRMSEALAGWKEPYPACAPGRNDQRMPYLAYPVSSTYPRPA